ncbi:MAG: FkbM family methyltransferase [Pirellulales bacterium]|nr:FkbM family methyltransferase [Pirellulales bacterium]
MPPRRPYALPNGLEAYGLSRTDTDLIYQEIFAEDVYRQHGVAIQDGDCIFDVGANTGLFVVFLNQICQRLSVYAFEPIPAICQILQKNVELHDRLGVKVHEIGLSREPAVTTFTYYPRISCASTMYPDNSQEEKQLACQFILAQFRKVSNRQLRWLLCAIPIPVQRMIAVLVRKYYAKAQQVTCALRTISEMVAEYGVQRIDLLKLDVERSELDVLAGIALDDWPKIRQAIVEVHSGQADRQAVEQQFVEHGFNVTVDRNPHLPNIYMLYAVRPVA